MPVQRFAFPADHRAQPFANLGACGHAGAGFSFVGGKVTGDGNKAPRAGRRSLEDKGAWRIARHALDLSAK